jgi:hypothetical protein
VVVDAPHGGMGNRDPETGEPRAHWFMAMDEITGSERGEIDVYQATIRIVPSPGVLGLLIAGAVARRRRQPSGVSSN